MSHTVSSKKYAPFVVTDDGQPQKLYGVWYEDPRRPSSDDRWSLIGSGMKEDNALSVAEALKKTRGMTLNESLDI